MGDSVSKFFLDNGFLEEPKEEDKELSKDVVDIIQLFRLLSVENKVKVRQLLKNENIF